MLLAKIIRRLLKKYWFYKGRKVLKSYGKNLRINAKCIFGPNVSVGNNVNFNGIAILGSGEVTIGDNFHSGIECMMITENHNYDKGKAIPYDKTYILKNITIEDNVWLGNRVLICGNIHIGEGAIIAAGSVVVTNIPKYAIVGGNPAKVLKYRNIEHYEELKRKQQFW